MNEVPRDDNDVRIVPPNRITWGWQINIGHVITMIVGVLPLLGLLWSVSGVYNETVFALRDISRSLMINEGVISCYHRAGAHRLFVIEQQDKIVSGHGDEMPCTDDEWSRVYHGQPIARVDSR